MRKSQAKMFLWILCGLVFCFAHGLDAKDADTKKRLQIGCEYPDAGVIQAISRKLAVSNPELEIFIYKTKPEEGLPLLEKGQLNILISDALPETKLSKKFQAIPFAVSAVKIIVSAENPISDISPEKIAGIFSRSIINWKELGGSDTPICIYGLNPESEATRTFEALIMGKNPIYDRILAVNSDKEIASLIASDKSAIGYSGMTNIKSKRIKILTLNKMEATVKNVISGKYKGARNLYMITIRQTEEVRKFTAALNSPAGNEALGNSGLIPLSAAK